MKAFLFSIALASIAFNSDAQVFFNQNFSGSGVYTDYVDIAATKSTNKFTSVNVPVSDSHVTASIIDGKLRFSRENVVGSTAGNAGSFNIFQLENPLEPASLFTKVSFDFTLSNNSEVKNSFGLFLACDNVGGAPTPPADNVVHSSLSFNATANEGEFSLSNETPKNAATTTSATTFTGTQTFTWFINNSGAIQTYTNPNGTTENIADDTYDLWVGNTLVFDGISAVNAGKNLNSYKFTLRNQPGALTVDFDNIVLEDLLNTLPVSLTTFTAKKQNENVLLSWAVASETDNDYFLIEKSSDGINFVKEGTVKSNGNSSAPANYSYTDYSPQKGINYYRLSQIDKSGKSTILTIRAVNFSLNPENEVLIYPNPSVSDINVELNGQAYDHLNLLNANGQVVLSSTIKDSQKSIKLDVSGLVKGIYVLQLSGPSGAVAKTVVIK